ncbi:MAG TPA: YcaO-like family protein [Solirubrobacteraceae bacterium]
MPAFAPGSRFHPISSDEVLVIGVGRQVALHGRAYALLAPLIDGRTTDDQLVARLADELPTAVVRLALIRLADQELIAYIAPGTGPDPLPAAGGSRDPLSDFQPPAPGELHWIAIGVDDAAVARLRGSLAAVRRGAAPGVTVAVVDDYLRPELDRLAARCRDRGAALLPIGIGWDEWWIGPYCEGATAEPTWRLLARRLRENRRDDLLALERGATFPLLAAGRFDAPADDPRFAYAIDAIGRAVTGDPPPALIGGLVVVEGSDGEPTRHPISTAAPTGLMLERVAPLISPITGVLGGLERVPAIAGTHVYATAGTLEWPDRGEDRRPVFRHGALGKGLTDGQARASCIGEALELASARFTGKEPRRRARWDELEEHAIHPGELLLISDGQYAEAAASQSARSWDSIPRRLDERHALEWVPSVSLTSGDTRWLPAAYCYFDYDDPAYPGPPFALANANGCAVGATREEAILQGLLELIERDACALWWYSRAPRPAIDLDSIGDSRLDAIRDAHAAVGRGLALLDLRADTEVAVVAAVAWEQEGGALLPIGRGCDLEPVRAVERALAELSQVTAVAGQAGEQPATVAQRPYLRPAPSPPVAVGELPNFPCADAQAGVDWCAQMLARLGHEVLVLDTTRSDIGLPAVRVVVPGLRPLLRRLAPGRLYDVPHRLGWVPRRLREAELNPEPFAT